MARAISIAVNFLLIVILAMQPVIACPTSQTCSVGSGLGRTCQGCGCCKVRSETEKCPCCSKKPIPSAVDRDCGHHPPQKKQQNKPSALRLRHKADTGAKLETLEVAPIEHLTLGVTQAISDGCTCVASPKPCEAPVPRSPIAELADVLSLNIVSSGTVDSATKPPQISFVDVPSVVTTRRFSQLSLCVWRL